MVKKQLEERIKALEAEVKRLNELVLALAARPIQVIGVLVPTPPVVIPAPLPSPWQPAPYTGPIWTGDPLSGGNINVMCKNDAHLS